MQNIIHKRGRFLQPGAISYHASLHREWTLSERILWRFLRLHNFAADLFSLPFVWILCLIKAKLWLNDKRSR